MFHFGILKPKEQIYSIREMASCLGINPNTVKKAYEELEKRKVITTISTKGTFISENISNVIVNRVDEKIRQIKNIIEDLEKMRNFKKRNIRKNFLE